MLDKVGPAKLRPQVTLTETRKGKEKEVVPADGSDTEESDEELLLDKAPNPNSNSKALPTPERSLSPDLEIDRGVEPGRIIGTAYPLRDFKKNLEAKDLVTKSVEDMGYVITQIVLKPFASKRHTELIECMREMRETCLTEDEIEGWNEFVFSPF